MTVTWTPEHSLPGDAGAAFLLDTYDAPPEAEPETLPDTLPDIAEGDA